MPTNLRFQRLSCKAKLRRRWLANTPLAACRDPAPLRMVRPRWVGEYGLWELSGLN